MAEIRVTILIEQDGQALPDFPVIRRYNVNETSGELNIAAAPDNNSTSFHPIAAATMPTMNVLYLASDQAVNVEINQNAALPLNAGGVVLILGANLAQASPTTNIEYNNPSSSITANLNALVGGT